MSQIRSKRLVRKSTYVPNQKNFSFDEKARSARREEKEKLQSQQYHPIRGDKFKEFILGLMKICCIPDTKAALYIEEMAIFERAFTHKSADEKNNYEFYEFMGDQYLSVCIAKYLTNRFPNLKNPDGSGVAIMARLKINLGSKKTFSKCAESFGFGDYIASSIYERSERMDSLLEDTLEAFAGALDEVQTKKDPNGHKIGYIVSQGPIYRLIGKYFDKLEISIEYDDLYDGKTRLKQLLEYKYQAQYETSETRDEKGKIKFVTNIRIPGYQNNDTIWGTGFGYSLIDSVQAACSEAVLKLRASGMQDKNYNK